MGEVLSQPSLLPTLSELSLMTKSESEEISEPKKTMLSNACTPSLSENTTDAPSNLLMTTLTEPLMKSSKSADGSTWLMSKTFSMLNMLLSFSLKLEWLEFLADLDIILMLSTKVTTLPLPQMFNEFSGALFRYGHSELPTEITRAD